MNNARDVGLCRYQKSLESGLHTIFSKVRTSGFTNGYTKTKLILSLFIKFDVFSDFNSLENVHEPYIKLLIWWPIPTMKTSAIRYGTFPPETFSPHFS